MDFWRTPSEETQDSSREYADVNHRCGRSIHLEDVNKAILIIFFRWKHISGKSGTAPCFLETKCFRFEAIRRFQAVNMLSVFKRRSSRSLHVRLSHYQCHSTADRPCQRFQPWLLAVLTCHQRYSHRILTQDDLLCLRQNLRLHPWSHA